MKAPFTDTLSSSSSEQPTEVSLCHSTTNPVTTEPLGTLPVMVMVVAVTVGVSSSTGAGGTVDSIRCNKWKVYASMHTQFLNAGEKHDVGYIC